MSTVNGRTVRPGPVTHFKGGRYVVLGTAIDTETGQYRAIYRPTRATDLTDADFYDRPLEMFVEDIEHNGQTVPRFDVSAQRSEHRCDLLAVVEDVLAEGYTAPNSLIALRALLDTQRAETIRLLAAADEVDESGEIVSAVASMLRLLDAAEHEINRAEKALNP